MYRITFKKSVLKILAQINEPHYGAITKAIYSLASNPRPQGYKKLKGRDGYRIRVGDYRIIYEIFENELLIDVINLGHRRDIYS